jgi:formate-dependent nitrite reductase membrane component NrfD
VLCSYSSIHQGFPPIATTLPYIMWDLLVAYCIQFSGITAVNQAAEVTFKGRSGLVSNRTQGTLIRRPSAALFYRRQ